MTRLLSAGVGLVLLFGCDTGSATSTEGASGATATGGVGGASGGSSSGAGAAGAAMLAGNAGTGPGGASSAGSAGQSGSGGAAGTANGGSAGANGGGSGGATSGCATALFCDDFESYTTTPGMPWSVRKNAQGAVAIDGAQHVSGTKAVKFTTTGAMPYQQAYISIEKLFPIQGNAFYGRMMIYTTKAPNDGVHWTNIQGEGMATMGITNADVRYGGQHQQSLMANYDSSGLKSDCWQHSQTKMPEAKWACMEWYFDGPNNTQKFWLDGAAIADLTVVGQGQGCIAHDTGDKWIFPTFSRLSLGLESYQQDDPREVWIDDVAIGTTQLGCPK